MRTAPHAKEAPGPFATPLGKTPLGAIVQRFTKIGQPDGAANQLGPDGSSLGGSGKDQKPNAAIRPPEAMTNHNLSELWLVKK